MATIRPLSVGACVVGLAERFDSLAAVRLAMSHAILYGGIRLRFDLCDHLVMHARLALRTDQPLVQSQVGIA